MQREAPLTPKSNRTTARVLTPRRAASGNRLTSHRATLAPNDFLPPAPGLFGKKRPPTSRQSVMPAVSSRQSTMPVTVGSLPSFLDTTKRERPEPENKDLEIKLLYDSVLRTTMMKLSLRKKLEENEKIIASQLATLAKEEDAIYEKLSSMKSKERNLQSLTELQNSLDSQLEEISTCLDNFRGEPVEILKQLRSILESLDTLKCTDIIIPEGRYNNRLETTLDGLLKKCGFILRSINGMIGSKRDTVTIADRGLKDFEKIYVDVRNYAKICKEALLHLQILILKEGARSLSQKHE